MTKMSRKLKISGKLLLILSGILFISIVANLLFLVNFSEKNIVVRVVDGDSLDLKDGRRIRLLGIDAPERGKCMFEAGKAKLEEMVLGKRVRLEDIVTDDYGRNLANVFVGNILVNKVLVEEGLARFVYVKSRHYEEMKKAQKDAKAKNLGIYSPLCRKTSPQSEECNIKGNIREGRKIYHLPNCPNYKEVIVDESFGDRWFCNEEEAVKEDFIKASGC
ncbi:thermonuclease family protein [Candidatus Roizmanbacteria bacterium]|nr:thermonuclease family protein [Candidatus Roizmanbacteria bacterium]